MAEPVGIFIEATLKEKNLKKLLNHKFSEIDFGKKVGYYFSKLLYDCNANPENFFIMNYDSKTKKCFIALLLNYFAEPQIAPFSKILQLIASLKTEKTANYAMVATTFPEVLKAYQINFGEVKEIPAKAIPKEIVEKLSTKFWSFSENNSFPEPAKAIKKRNYFYKNFKNFYNKYLEYIEETEKPNKIKQATKAEPFHLFDKIYSYDNKVFEFRNHTNQVIEIPQADPLSFRNVSSIYADANHVYLSRLAPNSPSEDTIDKRGLKINNPKAIWEYYIVEGIDGASFSYVKERWDTVYWKDKNSVFIYVREQRQLKKMKHTDADSFHYLGFCFGNDRNAVFFNDKILPINPTNFQLTDDGFIYDELNVFHFENKIDVDAKTFKVLGSKPGSNIINKTYILEDKNGSYEYNRVFKGEKVRKI